MAAMPFPRRALPAMARVKQKLPEDAIADVRSDVYRKVMGFGVRAKRVAITAGSRGIGGFVELLSGIAAAVRDSGGEPFIVPAMGSHGGATPEGQTEILRRL